MSNTLVINLTGITQHVGVVHEDGRGDHVQIMPRRRVELRKGMRVDPAWLGRNRDCVKVVSPQVTSPVVVSTRRGPNHIGSVALTVEDLSPNGVPEPTRTIADVEAEAQDQSTEGDEA